jgi:hypothetical protein
MRNGWSRRRDERAPTTHEFNRILHAFQNDKRTDWIKVLLQPSEQSASLQLQQQRVLFKKKVNYLASSRQSLEEQDRPTEEETETGEEEEKRN